MNRYMRILLLILIFIPIASIGNGGGANQPTEISRIGFLVGKWIGENYTPPTQWSPEKKTKAEVAFEWLLDKCHMEGTFSYMINEKLFCGHSIWSYSPSDKKYIMHWVDNFGFEAYTYNGNFADDSSLVLETTRKNGEQIVHEKLHIINLSSGQLKIISESDVDGDFRVGGVITVNKSEK